MSKNEFQLHKVVSGPLAGIGMLCIMLAKNWAVLSIGWLILFFFILVGLTQRLKRKRPQDSPVFEVGPLISADLERIKQWIKPTGIFVLILGLVGLVVSFTDEGTQHPGYAVFLVGIGVTCVGIGSLNRPLIVAGYGLWILAGAIVCVTAIAIESPLGMAQAITLGILLFLGGGLSTFGFLYGKTLIFEEGVWLSNGICPWERFDDCSITRDHKFPMLQLTLGKWKPVMAIKPEQEESLNKFLTKKFEASPQAD